MSLVAIFCPLESISPTVVFSSPRSSRGAIGGNLGRPGEEFILQPYNRKGPNPLSGPLSGSSFAGRFGGGLPPSPPATHGRP